MTEDRGEETGVRRPVFAALRTGDGGDKRDESEKTGRMI